MIGSSAFAKCRRLTSVTLPPTLTTVGHSAFRDCEALTAAAFAARPAPAFVAWAVASSRHRSNWPRTNLKGAVLRLIASLAVERRDVATLDPGGWKHVFDGCARLTQFKN